MTVTLTESAARGDTPRSITSNWQQYGACGDEDPELFFPTGGPGEMQERNAAAQRVCFQCPVMEQCLNWALETGQDIGVWGGLSAKDRRRLRRGKGCEASSVAVEAGYRKPDLDAVEAYLAGERKDVHEGDRLAAIVAGVEQGMTYKEFDELHGLPRNTTCKFVSQMRQSFKGAGIEFPLAAVRSVGRRTFTDAQVKRIRERVAAGEVTVRALSAEFEVHRTTIESVLTGQSYPDAGGPVRGVRGRRAASVPVQLVTQDELGVAA